MSARDISLIRILLVDAHTLVRASLRTLLNCYPEFQVVGDAGAISEALAIASREQPDIIVLEASPEPAPETAARNGISPHKVADSHSVTAAAVHSGDALLSNPAAHNALGIATPPGVNAPSHSAPPQFEPSSLFSFIANSFHGAGTTPDTVDFMPALLEVAPDAQIILLTGSNDMQLHRRAVAQGAKGLLRKDCSPEVLIRAIECVYAGEVWIERIMMASVLAEFAQAGAAASSTQIAAPTARELDVIVLLCEGLPNRQIAARLAISETTVRRHLTTIFSKLGVSDRLELVIYAYRNGLAGFSV